MSGATSDRSAQPPSHRWRLWDHIGMISGTVLGLMFMAFLVVLAIAGYTPAFGLIVVIVVGFALVVFGGHMHGPRRRG